MKELESYYAACNTLLKAFCEKHEFDYDEAKNSWVGDDVGGVVCCCDYFFGMDVIVTDLRENADEGELLDWYDYVMRCSNLGVSSVNFRSWLKRCPVISENDFRIMEEAKQRVDHATRDFKELIKKYSI